MEEMKSRYIKILIGFIVMMLLSTFTIKNHVKNISKARETAEVLQVLNAEAQTKSLEPQESNIKQVRIAEEPRQETVVADEVAVGESSDEQNYNLRKEGLKKMAEGDIDNAILYLEEAFEKGDVDFKKANAEYLIQCYEQKGYVPGVISVYDRLLAIAEDDSEKIDINNRLAEYFMKIGNKKQASEYYETKYKLTNSIDDLILVADVLEEIGEKDRLNALIQDHIIKFPQDKEVLSRYIKSTDFENSQE